MKSFVRVIDAVAFGSVAALGFLIVPSAYDPFRHPKVLLLHAAGITLIGLLAAAVILGAVPLRELFRRTPATMLVGAILIWTAITAAFSAHKPTALFAFLTAASAAAIFMATSWGARRYPLSLLLVVVIPGAVNALLAILQELKIWNAFAAYESRHLHVGTVGLMGNPNDVGSYLVPGFLAAAAWFFAARSTLQRVLLAPVMLLILGGVAASRTRGAVLGIAAGLAALIVARWRKRGLAWVVALTVIGVFAAGISLPIVEQLIATPVETLLSGRIIAFAAGWRMFTDNPLFGVGPGHFEYAYFDYASRVYPSMIEYSIAGRQYMFGEAHNDHLQIAAENGAIGWLLFAASLVVIAMTARRRASDVDSPRVRFARLGGLTLAIGLAALALFQFPLYLAGPLSAFVCTAGIINGWAEDDETVAA